MDAEIQSLADEYARLRDGKMRPGKTPREFKLRIEKLARRFPISQLAARCNISDSALRRWCNEVRGEATAEVKDSTEDQTPARISVTRIHHSAIPVVQFIELLTSSGVSVRLPLSEATLGAVLKNTFGGQP